MELKTAKSRRTLGLPGLLLPLLKAQRQRRLEQRMLAGAAWQDQDLLFTVRGGGPISPNNALRAFKKVLRAAELPGDLRIHDLRHTSATMLLAAGVPDRTT